MFIRIVGIVTLAFFTAFSFAPMAVAAAEVVACRMEKAEECKHANCPKHSKKEAAKEEKKTDEHAACSKKHGAKNDEANKEEAPSKKDDSDKACSISCCDHEDLNGASSDPYVPSCEKQSRVFGRQQNLASSVYHFVSHSTEPFERPPAIG